MVGSPQDISTPAEQEAALLERLRLRGVTVKPKNGWKQTIGWAHGSQEHLEAMRLGAAWRSEVNRKSTTEPDGCS
ncbi:MAG: hypothetical protein ACO1TE_20260 [Prosthecobacter sp.]